MIRVTVIYPADDGTHFDHDYYRTVHMPLIKERLGSACLGYAIDRGIGGMAEGSGAPYVALCHIFSPSLETFQNSFGPHAAEIVADVANFTDHSSIIQISETTVTNFGFAG